MPRATTVRPEGFSNQRLYRVPPAVIRRMSEGPHLRDFLVTDLGYFPNASGHAVHRPDGTRCYVLIFVEDGEGWLELGDRHYTLRRGEALLIPFLKPHAYGAASKDPWKIYWFHFSGKGAEALLRWSDFSENSPVCASTGIDGLRRQFRTALDAVERGYTDHSLLELSRVLINVLTQFHARPRTQTQSRSSDRIEQIMEYMRANADKPEALADYARRSGLSVSRFSDTFRKHCGVSPMTYLTELRIQRACELLDNTDLQVNEIADRLGFSDALYFSRIFRKHAGMTASAYRNLP